MFVWTVGLTSRERVQAWLWQHNPQLARMETIQTALKPDGDAEVHEEFVNQMKVPQCPRCSGLLKPNVVFYGSTVNKKL